MMADEMPYDDFVDRLAGIGFEIPAEDREFYHAAVVETLAGLLRLDPDTTRAAGRVDRTWRPADPVDDPYHAIVHWCDIRETTVGPLSGWRLGVKDTIPVAEVPLTLGGSGQDAPIAGTDAVVVSRVLEAGAAVVAKTSLGAVRGVETANPADPERSPGYSSAGSGSAVASGLLRAALGTDGAGSVRIPGAWCGIVAMKPTVGLVPSTFGSGPDSVIGPMTRTVADNATLLEVIAGEDWQDPGTARCRLVEHHYRDRLDRGVSGIRVGVLSEALDVCNAETQRGFAAAVDKLQHGGARVKPVSVASWRDARTVYWLTRGTWPDETGQVAGSGFGGLLDLRSLPAIIEHRCPTVERSLTHLIGGLLGPEERSRAFARAQNARIRLRRQINRTFDAVDLIVTPTTPVGPYRRAERSHASRAARWHHLAREIYNTVPLNVTGHPAITVPAPPSSDLPVGFQIIGPYFAEAEIYRAAAALAPVP